MLPLACISMAGRGGGDLHLALDVRSVRGRGPRTCASAACACSTSASPSSEISAAGGHEMGGVSEREHAPKGHENSFLALVDAMEREPPWRNVSARSRTHPRCRASEDGRDEARITAPSRRVVRVIPSFVRHS